VGGRPSPGVPACWGKHLANSFLKRPEGLESGLLMGDAGEAQDITKKEW
jgi:hypothetical protein